jgi:hypothetical protein
MLALLSLAASGGAVVVLVKARDCNPPASPAADAAPSDSSRAVTWVVKLFYPNRNMAQGSSTDVQSQSNSIQDK